MSKLAIICSCGLAASVLAVSGVNTGRPVESSFRTSGIKAPVQKSDFAAVQVDQRSLDMQAATIARKVAVLDEQVARASTRAPFASAQTPNFFYFNNIAIPLNLKPQMALLINVEGEGNQKAAAIQALAQAGIAITPDVESASRFVVVNLLQVARSTEEMRTLIERVLATGLVSYAAPVFDNELINDGFRIPTPEILVSADRDQSTPVAIHNLTQVVEAQIGPSQGVSQLRSTSANGFDVMAQANAMHTAAGVRWATVDFLQSIQFAAVPNDSFFDQQWQHMQNNDIDMDSELAWDFTVGNAAIKVAILDNGVQLNHPDLNTTAGRDFTSGAVGGTGDGSPIDACDNHGTAVAGCVSAKINNNLGVAGGAPNTLSMGERIGIMSTSNCNVYGTLQNSWLINAINYALTDGARVTNSSFRTGFDQAVMNAYNDTHDSMVHCASSGNDGVEGVVFPAISTFVISCGGYNSNGDRYGNWGQGLDVCAPAVGVGTTDRTGTAGYTTSDFGLFTGTSFASPLTASVAALFLSEFPFASTADVSNCVLLGCTDVGPSGPDTDYGYGRINLNNTLLQRAPSNYDCFNAAVIPAVPGVYNPVVYSTRWAANKTIEPLESCEVNGLGTSSCVYYSFICPSTGIISLNTNGSDYDTVVSVFDGCATASGNPAQLACDDDGGDGTQSQLLNIPVTYGQQLIIKVAKYGTAGGGGNLDFNFYHSGSTPTNDLCDDATPVTFASGTYSYVSPVNDTQLATTSICENDETCGAFNNGHSVWYTFTAPFTGTVNIDTELSDYDTVLSVFPGCASIRGECARQTQIACNDDVTGGVLQSRINNLNVVTGQTYLIKVSSYNSTAGGGLFLRLGYNITTPPNNSCDNAIVISGNLSMDWSSPLIDVRGATVAACESTESCGFNNGKSVWWKFMAQRNGHLTIDTVGSNYDTVLSVYPFCAYTGAGGCNQVNASACNDDATPFVSSSQISNFAIASSNSYVIKLAAYNSLGGDAQINIHWVVECPADFNNDGSVDFFDYLDFVDAFSAGSTGADFNGDGSIDFFDYLDFVDAFSIGC